MKIVDARGMGCPKPLIETKKAMKDAPGESLRILIDNEISVKNVSHFLEDNGLAFEKIRNGNVWEMTVGQGKTESVVEDPDQGLEKPATREKDYVVLFAKKSIGEGPEELGDILVGSLLESLKAQDVLPSRMIFLNSGIHLVSKGSDHLNALVELELNGVEIISCGTCLNYFGKTESLSVGRVSNMFEITEILRNAGKIINI